MIRQLFVLIVILVLLTACTSATEAPAAVPATETPTSVPPPTSTPVSCQPSEILDTQVAFGEIQGDMQSEGELWALLFFKTAWTKADQKIVWRITGEGGEFEAKAQSEDGTVIQPVWEQHHESSTWGRPGLEWGTGFNFPTPGCWTITVTSGETTGTISLKVLGTQ
jgi:hypothetical protein